MGDYIMGNKQFSDTRDENIYERYKEFIGLNSLNKTLRNTLIPIGNTLKYIQEHGILEEDSLRAEKREELKAIMDDYYRNYIEVHLRDVHDINWGELFDALEEVKKKPTDAAKKHLEKVQEKKRKEIYQYLSDDVVFSEMFKEKMISGILPDFIRCNEEYSEEEQEEKLETVVLFHRFTSSFGDFFLNRKNVFAKEAIATAIGYRVVHENAEIFLENMVAFQNIQKSAESQISIIERKNEDHFIEWRLSHIFTADYYMMLMTQREIEHYNEICGAVNQHMKEYCQKEKKNWNLYRMKKLHKQILSKTATSFEIPGKYDNDAEVYESVNRFLQNVIDKKVLERVVVLKNSTDSFDLNKIYITAPYYEKISNYLCESWNTVTSCLTKYYEQRITGEGERKAQKVKAAVKADKWKSLSEIERLLEEYASTEEIKRKPEEYITEIENIVSLKEVHPLEYHPEVNLIENEKYATEIKDVLDNYMNLLHWMKRFYIEEAVEKEVNFYGELDDLYEEIKDIVPLYNKVRNYVTQKPYSDAKIKLNFGTPTLANGWSKSKEYDYNAILLQKDRKYYLGIFNPTQKPEKQIIEGYSQPIGENEYKKMVYYYLPSANKMLPKVLLSKKGIEIYQPSEYIINGYKERRHIKSEEKFNLQFCHDLIDYFKSGIEQNPDWKVFGFHFSDTDTYQDISGFYREVEEQGYKIGWTYIKEADIDRLNKEGKLYLFQIYNKDFSEKSTGRENLHTMYLKNLFSEENAREQVLKLNGEAEIFFRKSSVKEPIIHKKGTMLVNRTYMEEVHGESVKKNIPEKVYQEIYNYKNHRLKGKLSSEAKKYLEKAVCHEAEKDIVKDYRYSVDKFFIHLPITINYKASGKKSLNTVAQRYIAHQNDMNVIGIDRGERNLIYVSVINMQGEIIEQKSFNVVNKYDYKEKLKEREQSRDEARKNWKEIGQIKDLKEGYLSGVIHEIAKMMIEHHAIIAMEDLNYGFKRGRFKVERQVYQKFENMLIQKLNYLVFKERPADEDGGILRGYQLAYIPDSVKKMGRQCGMIFYVPAAFTSKIDPTTGFVDIFNHKAYTTDQAKREFILSFDEICYDVEKKIFRFTFDYTNFATHNVTLARNNWTIYTNGTRTQKEFSNGRMRDKEDYDPKDKMVELLESEGIEFRSGQNLIPELEKVSNTKIFGELQRIVRFTVQLRNSRSESTDAEYDRLISPVLNEEGKFFDSFEYRDKEDEEEKILPVDADANGAYCIALKGLYTIQAIQKNWSEERALSPDVLRLNNTNWFDYIQNKRYR
mgnify:CR=1 FL=1